MTAPRPLRPDDDRLGFDCGSDLLNRWLRRRAWTNEQANLSRTMVICAAQSGDIAGYVSLGAGAVACTLPPHSAPRDRPPPRPVVVLGQLAVDRTFQGQGCARALMHCALTATVRSARDIGGFGVLTYPVDEVARAFFKKFGFLDLSFDPAGGMMVRAGDLVASGFNP